MYKISSSNTTGVLLPPPGMRLDHQQSKGQMLFDCDLYQ